MRGLRVRPSRFRGHTDALWLGTREIAHCHNGQVDVRLTRSVVRELRDELRSDARIDLRDDARVGTQNARLAAGVRLS